MFAATYTMSPPDQPDCGWGLKGEMLGAGAFYPPKAGENAPDLGRAMIAIEPDQITALLTGGQADPDASDKRYSMGSVTTATPGADNFCVVPTLSPAIQNLPPVAEETDAGADGGIIVIVEGKPEVHIRYEWSNLKIYLTPAEQGTQISADLKITKSEADAGACSQTYHVIGLAPAVGCTLEDGGLDPGLCDPSPDPSQGRAYGSGISPSLSTTCDPDLGMCVLTKEPPAFK